MKRLPKSNFSQITTLEGLSEDEVIIFSKCNLKRFFKVTLWDKSHLCAYCNKEINSIDSASLDHIVPRKYGGHLRLANLQLMHSKCNGIKSDQMPSVSSDFLRLATTQLKRFT